VPLPNHDHMEGGREGSHGGDQGNRDLSQRVLVLGSIHATESAGPRAQLTVGQNEDMTTIMTVGGATAPLDEVLEFAGRYLSGAGGWAYPAYDAYPGTPGAQVGEADLLAVCLLNAGQNPIPTYYGLQALMPAVNKALDHEALTGSLWDATSETLTAVADLFGILDEAPTAYVGKTKLMKVLHRKRPDLIPLFDENIRRCYSELGDAPVPAMRRRTHRDFAVAWLPALQKDLQDQMELWEQIAGMAQGVPITPLRALDIVGWWMGRK
jgi:hypothetical protein